MSGCDQWVISKCRVVSGRASPYMCSYPDISQHQQHTIYNSYVSLCYDVVSRLQASVRLCQDVRHPKCVYILTYLNIHNILQQLCQLMSGCDQWITSKCQVVSGLGSVYLDINNIISCHVSTSTTYYNCVSWLLIVVSKNYWYEYVILTHLIPVRSHIHICIYHAFFSYLTVFYALIHVL